MYRVREFAQLSGVTVRALHHYDRLGLLVPQRQASARADRRGYRIYTAADLERLEQIVALRTVGFPLRQIQRLLQDELRMSDALRLQQRLLRDQQQRIGQALEAIQAALRARTPDARRLQRILSAMAAANSVQGWAEKYYSAAARAKLAVRARAFPAERQAEASRQWAALLTEVEAALSEDPRSAKVQRLAARWRGLVRDFTQGDADLSRGLERMWADRRNWPAEMKDRTAACHPRVMALMRAALRAGGAGAAPTVSGEGSARRSSSPPWPDRGRR
jgi:DNA-binding transcriptional MerR regulator